MPRFLVIGAVFSSACQAVIYVPPPPGCGNGVADSAEACDGADVRGASCASLGRGAGVVRCRETCDAIDLSGCAAVLDGGTDAGTADSGSAPDGGPSMHLHVANGWLARADGSPVDVRGAISCCGGGYGWPLFDDAWLDILSARGGTFLHVRLGPFLTGNPNGETDWAVVGGGYVEVGGRADTTQFNPAFWARVRALLEAARARGVYVEIDVADGWAVKHCRWGDIPGYSAWDPAFTVSGVDGCATAGSGPISPGSLHDRWVRKVVQETGTFENVLYQDGNELGLVPGYSTTWTISMHDIIRDEEARLGVAPHLFGTNSGSVATMQHRAVDYVEQHQNQAAQPAQCAGKPCLVNEYNPDPPLTPEQFKERFCQARALGTAFWYWRHGQDHASMVRSLDLMGGPCP